MSSQLLFFKGISLISRHIRLFTWGEYSHVGVLTSDGRLIEAWHKGGVIENDLEEAPHTPGTIVDVYGILTDFNEEVFLSELRSEVGKGYDYFGIVNFIRRKNANNWDRWFCSELVHAKLARAGALTLNAPCHKVSPTMLSYSPNLHKMGSFEFLGGRNGGKGIEKAV